MDPVLPWTLLIECEDIGEVYYGIICEVFYDTIQEVNYMTLFVRFLSSLNCEVYYGTIAGVICGAMH